jgi:6,7-dimethyl-8-ribityllumazine synthase
MAEYPIQQISGNLVADGSCRIAIVASRFNSTIVERLVTACIDTLIRHGAHRENLSVTWVPGAFELPLVAKRWAESSEVDAVICLGTVIRGATPHFDYVCSQAASGIGSVAVDTGIPVIFGVLTTETIEQALERAGTKAGNKGADAATAALETLSVLQQIPCGVKSQS